MNNPNEEIFINLYTFGSDNSSIHRLIILVMVFFTVSGLVIVIMMLFHGPMSLENLFLCSYIVLFFVAIWYQSGRIINKFQLSSSGIILDTIITKNNFPPSDISDILVKRSIFYWYVLTISKVSTKRKSRYWLYPSYTGEVAPMYFETTLRDAIMKYKNYLSNGRLTSASS